MDDQQDEMSRGWRRRKGRVRTPIWLWTTRLMPSRPSRRAACEPDVTNAAAVSGTRPAESRRSKVQWYDPADR
jgi:hypothetical protein